MTPSDGARPATAPGGPESIFRVESVRRSVGGDLLARQVLGPHTRDGVTGRTELAALGVLIDHTLGYAVNEALDSWSVSTEVSVDVSDQLPATGALECVGRVVHVDAAGALAMGELLSPEGEILARAVLRGRLSPLQPDTSGLAGHGAMPPEDPDRPDLDAALGSEVTVAPEGLAVAVGPRFLNPIGHLHGGMHLCLLERAASLAVPQLPRSASMRVQLVRAVPAGSELVVGADVIHHGRTLAVVRVTVRTSEGRLCSSATVVRH